METKRRNELKARENQLMAKAAFEAFSIGRIYGVGYEAYMASLAIKRYCLEQNGILNAKVFRTNYDPAERVWNWTK